MGAGGFGVFKGVVGDNQGIGGLKARVVVENMCLSSCFFLFFFYFFLVFPFLLSSCFFLFFFLSCLPKNMFFCSLGHPVSLVFVFVCLLVFLFLLSSGSHFPSCYELMGSWGFECV